MNSKENQVYLPRVIDRELKELLPHVGGVVLEGPRGCGKTSTGRQFYASQIYLDTPSAQQVGAVDPASLLVGEKPRLLDEWQTLPVVWDLARHQVDESQLKGQFVFAGSAVPAEQKDRHTGAARFMRLRQYSMTWAEKSDDLGQPGVSLAALFDGVQQVPDFEFPELSLEEIVSRIVTPGFPALRDVPERIAGQQLLSYLSDSATKDVFRAEDLRVSPTVVDALFTALARATATETSQATLLKDVAEIAKLSAETLTKLLDVLQRIFVLEVQPAWNTKLRSTATLRKKPKYHLADPALAVAKLGASSQRLRTDLETLGFLFESAVFHDLQVFAQGLGGKLFHYRDSNNREIDIIIQLADGRWAAIEVKLGFGQASAAIDNLSRINSDIQTEPAFCAVITGTGRLLRSSNGTWVIPLHLLRP